jgi:diguanylate cyclase (GGDEF)-like protein
MGKGPGRSQEAVRVSGSGTLGGSQSKRHHVWMLTAAALLVGGLVASLFAAESVARSDASRSSQEFDASSAEVASTLQLAIQHETDLIVSASGFIAGDPTASNAEFVRWASSVEALERYPELIGFGRAVIVPAAELPAFAARAVTDPAGPLAADGTFEVVPPGTRSYYCLAVAAVQRGGGGALPAGHDFCSPGPAGSVLLSSRDSGESAYLPIQAGKAALLSVQTPVYQGGAVPATVEARRQAFLGWVGMAVMPQVDLSRALQGHPDTAVAFEYRAGSSNVVFRSGRAPRGAKSAMTDLHNGWTVTTFGPVTPSGALRNDDALALLLGGFMLSVLLGVLLFVLGTSRERALRVVGEQTGELRHQALHDALTGLPNRALIMDRIEQLLFRNRRHGTVGAALYIDLDEFKNVNDTLGHEAGDQLLVAVAARLESALRDADTIGRMGGDEFVVLIDGATLEVAPELVADRLLEVMRQPFELEGAAMPLIVNTSIGIAVGDRPTPVELLRDADVALYEAKAAGKNRYEMFHPEMQTEISHRIELEFDLRSALAGDQFRVVYQPIYNLDDLTIVGVEALLRWDHPTQGLVQPDEFIPLLEQSGQIREVGRWVLRQACEQMAAWHAQGDTLDISVNVSGRQLDDDTIIQHIREALDASGLDARSLIIEITETALMRNAEATARRLGAIKELGVRIAVDDFGTGYSSLAYLRTFPVDCLKIDRSFVDGINSSPESKALIGTLVQLGKDLGLKTLAEGVETPHQLDHLRGEHVDEGQGFLLARPLDPHTFEHQLLAPTRPTVATISRP